MSQVNILFLIDVNGVPRDPSALETAKIKVEVLDDQRNESTEIFPFKEEEPSTSFSAQPNSAEVMEWLKEFVLVTLFKEANSGDNEYDFSRVHWSFKFFNSSQLVDYRDGRSFMPFDHESFKNFETQLNHRMNPNSTDTANVNAYSQLDCSRIKYLSDAIKIITGSLPWTEETNPNFSKSFNAGDNLESISKNSVYAFFRVPRTEKMLEEFSDLQGNSSTKDFMSILLPSAFSYSFHHKMKIQLNFVDMWAAPENKDHCFDPDWKGNYPRQIVRCLQYLGNGKVMPVPLSELSMLRNTAKALGLIPYVTQLRSLLLQASTPNENIPSCIQKFAAKNSLKISPPDFDSGSVSRSFRSASVLEASFNCQNQQQKSLRPFRMSSGYEDDDSSDYLRNKIARDRFRGEGERKRKRVEYDTVEHDNYDITIRERQRLHHSAMLADDVDEDSIEVDSQCAKDQRLRNWVNDANDGVLSTKRKKNQLDTTATVPMSRPALSKSFHVFHEPAPKLPGSRGKKMLLNVERKKIKVHREAEIVKRRSSGAAEGLLDMKRIAQQQEKELSAIKRRLKSYLEGELENVEGDPISWMNKLRKVLRSFADMILQEDKPCLVALAQALVNCASIKFTPTKVNDIKKIYGRQHAGITAKDLLEDMLLWEFTSLNRRIIAAHEVNKDKMSPNYGQNHKLQKILTFRETELQIILRLEIAWCFFIEPDEDATEELLAEISRLLQIIAAYRTDPPIECFVNTVLLPTYSQSSRFMRGLYKKLNIPLPSQLAMDGSPVPNSSRRDDDSSMISSTSSANLYPEDSASQLHMHKRHRPTPAIKHTVGHRKPNSGSKKVIKRQIMVASTSNPKLPSSSSHYMLDHQHHQKRSGGGNKVSPKRVRRNLFDVQKKDKKDSKTLLTLSSSSGSRGLLKSPAYKVHKSPLRSPSAFFRAARSRKQLVMGNSHSQPAGGVDHQFGSPRMHPEVLCPESPVTPGDRLSMASRYAPTSTSLGSTERPRVIQESPEVLKTDFANRPMGRVASLSFYSTNSGAPKSRVWEKSETQLMAARIKESVDLRSKELTLSDLEILPRSTDKLKSSAPASDVSDSPETNLSICDDSYIEPHNDDKGLSPFMHAARVAPGLDNPNIQALITSDSLFPSILAGTLNNNIRLPVVQTDPPPKPVKLEGSPVPLPTTTATTVSPSNLQTPSKRVQFNLKDNLVNTPSSARRSGIGTPKSILKDATPTHDTAI